MTIDDIKTNGFTRCRLFRILIAVKFGLEGYPHVFEMILHKRAKQLFSKWKDQKLIWHEIGKESASIFFKESPFMKLLRENGSFDGGTFIQETLVYDGYDRE